MTDIEQFVAYEKEKEHRGTIRAFFIALVVYVVVNVGLFTIDMLTEGGPWFFWPLIGWGIGMVFFGLGAFVWSIPKGRDLEEELRIQTYLSQHARGPETTA